MKRILTTAAISTAAALMLAGCFKTPMDVAKNNCQGYGFTPGTSEYRQCLQQERIAEQRHRQQVGQSMMMYGQQLQQQSQPRTMDDGMTNCTTTYQGNTANTTCY